MKVTIYTISDCPFSKQEKEYLASKNIPFEEKNLEQKREYIKEMLEVSNNFAGTPVTKIEKDNGEVAVLKGYTQGEVDEVLGLSVQGAGDQAPSDQPQEPPTPPQPTPPTPQPEPEPTPPPTPPTPPQPTPTPPVEEPKTDEPPVSEPPKPPPADMPGNGNGGNNPEPPAATTPQSDPLSSILQQLQAKSDVGAAPAQPQAPQIPDFK